MNLIERLVRPEVRALTAYHVPSAEGLIKLDAMENPYSLPENLRDAWLQKLRNVELNRYPDADAGKLKSKIRAVFDVPDELGLVLGNGSDELIQIVASLVGGPGRGFMAPSPTFSMYEIISIASSTIFNSVPLDKNFEPDETGFLQEIERVNPACIFIAYPNNPTANSFSTQFIESVIKAAPGLVLIDEAYYTFSGKTFLQRLEKYPNMLLMRTLSKSGLAGLRLGMIMGHPEWVQMIEKIRLPYNINCLTQVSAEFCLDHYSVFSEQAAQIVKDRAWLAEQLSQLDATIVYPSDTNFILVRIEQGATSVFEALKNQGILVKNLDPVGGALINCLRLTVGTPNENSRLVEALRACLE